MVDNTDRDKGGRLLPGKRIRVYNFITEVCVESPKEVDEHEAAEDAAEFMASTMRARGRVHSSFCSITRVDEAGPLRPEGIKIRTKPTIVEGGLGPKSKKRIKVKSKKA